jgi:hypothetical protein
VVTTTAEPECGKTPELNHVANEDDMLIYEDSEEDDDEMKLGFIKDSSRNNFQMQILYSTVYSNQDSKQKFSIFRV